MGEPLSMSACGPVVLPLTPILSVINPTTGKLITKISEGTRKDVDLAVAAAHKAYQTVWGMKVRTAMTRPDEAL